LRARSDWNGEAHAAHAYKRTQTRWSERVSFGLPVGRAMREQLTADEFSLSRGQTNGFPIHTHTVTHSLSI